MRLWRGETGHMTEGLAVITAALLALALALLGLGHDLAVFTATGIMSPADLVGELLLAFLAGVLGVLFLLLIRQGAAC